MTDSWEGARFTVLQGADSLADCGGRLPKGKILVHHSGNFVLRCPACGAMQYTTGTLSGSPDHPTIDRAVHCGAGICKRCGVWFRVQGGIAIPDSKPAAAQATEIPEALRRAGVRPATKLADAIASVTQEINMASKRRG